MTKLKAALCKLCGESLGHKMLDPYCVLCREATRQYRAAVAECVLTGDQDKDADAIVRAVEVYEERLVQDQGK